jgi:uncharacterized protein
VQAAIDLLDGGATVPFIARYRKEATGGLDDIQLRELEARLAYLRELHDRRAAVLKSIAEQGKLTPELRAAIDAAPTKQELEDLYLPYKPKRRTKGMIAREAGIEPLADQLFADPTLDPEAEAKPSSKPKKARAAFTTVPAVLDGVRDILSERWAEDAALVQSCANGCGPKACCKASWPPARTRTTPKSPSSATISTTTTDPPRAVAPRAGGVPRPALEILDAKLVLPEAEAGASSYPQATPSLAEGRIALHLGWSHQGRARPTTCCASAWPGPGASSSA